jgi:hypothetical protein
MTDSIEVVLLPRLMAHLEAAASKVRVRVRAIDRFDVLEQLDRDRLQLGVAGLLTEGAVHHKRRRLYRTNYLCLYDPARLPLAPPLTLEDYIAVPHVSGGVQASRDLGGGGGMILAFQQDEASGLDGLVVKARRNHKEETDPAADAELARGDRAGQNGRIGEQQTAAPHEQTGPFR